MRAIKAWLFLGTISLASALASEQIAHAFQGSSRPAADDRRAVAIANRFLLAIEEGRLDFAHAMLIREARAEFTARQLAPRVPLGRRGGFVRHYSSRAEVSKETAFYGWGRSLPGRFTYRIICYNELPVGGFGPARFVSVIVRSSVGDQVWFPVIYKIESSRSPHCPS